MKPMQPEDVPDELVEKAARAIALLQFGGNDDRWEILSDYARDDCRNDARPALAAVIPLIEARERGACAEVLEARIRELQHNIDDNIAEVRVVEMKPADNRPLIKTRDWLRDVLTTIRARNTP